MTVRLIKLAGGSSYAAYLRPDFVYRTISFTNFRIASDGYIYFPDTSTQVYRWLIGRGTSADYEARSTITGGTPGTFTTDPSAGSWISLATSQTWQRGGTSGVIRNVTATFEIRAAASGTILTSASIDLECDVP